MINEIIKFKKAFTNNGNSFDEYTIVFSDGSVYTMSYNANQPNGFCQFLDIESETNIYPINENDKLIEYELLPYGTQRQIKNIESFDYDEIINHEILKSDFILNLSLVLREIDELLELR